MASTLVGVTVTASNVCNACNGDFSHAISPATTGAPKDITFHFPKVIPDSAQDDYVIVAASGGTVINPLPNDEHALHAPDALRVTTATGDANGACVVETPFTVKVTPNSGATAGTCTYTYNSNETDGYAPGDGDIGDAVIHWGVLPEPQPLAAADFASVDAWYADNEPASAGTDVDTTIDLLANDSDPQGGTLAVTSVPATSSQGGTIVDNADGTVGYTPAQDFCGADTFQYELTASGASVSTRTATGIVDITVKCNNPPVAVDDSFSVVQGGTVAGTPSVKANDLDFEDPTSGLVYAVDGAGPSNAASFTLNPDGTFTYTHDGSVTPTTDTFDYKVCDQHATMQPPSDPTVLPRCATATATINIGLAPQANPVPVADAASVDAYYSSDGQAATSVTVDVAANDSDPDGNLDPTTTTVLTGPNPVQGTLTNNSDGTFKFEPADGYSGLVTVVYQICDDKDAATPPATSSLCGSAALLITVVGNAPPVGFDDTATAAPGSSGTTINLIANDVEPGGEGLSVTSVDATSAQGGTVTDNGDGTVSYAPAAGFVGEDTFEYTVCDEHVAAADSGAVSKDDPWIRCDTAKVTVQITNNAPVAVDDAAATPANTAVEIDALANDSDPDGDTFAVKDFDATSVGGGTVVNNTFTYTPPAGFSGLDTFNYTIEDPSGATSTATVRVVVGDVDADEDGDGIPDWIEIIICGSPTCADGSEDADGNGIPDWREILLCGAAGCVDVDFIKSLNLGECPADGPFEIPGTVDFDVPSGFTSNSDIDVTLWDVKQVLYDGPLPPSGTVELGIPKDLTPGEYTFVVMGTDASSGQLKVDGCTRLGELAKSESGDDPKSDADEPAGTTGGDTGDGGGTSGAKTEVGGTSATPSSAGSLARTGSSPQILGLAALMLVLGGLILKRRRSSATG
ncbi:MAG: Ig-like domain-containing protein [Microthrixaceae bacterium]